MTTQAWQTILCTQAQMLTSIFTQYHATSPESSCLLTPQRAQAEGEWCQWEENLLWSHFFPLLPCLISLATRQPLSRLSFTWETRLQSQCRGRLPSASMTSEMKDLCRCEIGHTVKQKNVFLPGLITGNCLIQRSKPALAK